MYILLKKQNQQTQTPVLKDTPQLEVSLSSTQVENYFNTGEKGNYKEININWNDSRQYYSMTVSSVSLNWQTGGSWARISYLKHPIWKQKFVVIHMTAKHDLNLNSFGCKHLEHEVICGQTFHWVWLLSHFTTWL